MNTLRPALLKSFLAACMALGGASAHALSFECVNLSNDCTTAGTSIASWSLSNNVLSISNAATVGNQAVITGISFDLAAGQSVSLAGTQGTGVLYTTGGGANLPASLGWSIDAEFKPATKPMTNGINAGETLSFLLGGVSLADIQSGAFRFGVHVQALPTLGGSEKLINTTAVPEPQSLALALAGLGLVASLARRRRASAAR
ncbi:PEP-CTERM sorting domain-containing protein [Aquabacterium sp. UBA2148]|uniref:PEP-CTERM sorting domain-containing protein n=1 Tax=Aquabacterium sp. UBA2148 TaxID=1946042 RepID=UPI0025804BDF|nr:PEP-CTERM sorting domain-containing protein [Aquabacterium sp. UBA2148]